MERAYSIQRSVALSLDTVGNLLNVLLSFFCKTLLNAFCQLLRSKIFVGDTFVCSCFGLTHHSTPERLVAEEGNDHRWFCQLKTYGASTSASVMYNCLALREEPVVRRIFQHEDVVWAV